MLGTILGACLGLATNSVPGIFHQPLLLLACLAVASVVLGVLARPQRRTAIVLALLTLCAVSLCGYEAFCCSPRGAMSPVDTFLARMGSVSGWSVHKQGLVVLQPCLNCGHTNKLRLAQGCTPRAHHMYDPKRPLLVLRG